MNTKVYKKEINLPDGRVISIETGKLAKQADGSAVIQMGNALCCLQQSCHQEQQAQLIFYH